MPGWLRAEAARLALEALEQRLVFREVLRKELEGDLPPEAGVLGFVDDTHATLAQLRGHAVMRNRLADQRFRLSGIERC
jgi:hypothetical protein